MKVCSTCGKRKELSEFNKNKSRPDGFQYSCRPCQNRYTYGHYSRNKPYYVKKARSAKLRQFEINRTYITRYLSSHPCVDCGEADHMVLEFDHVRGDKLNSVSVLAYSLGASLKRIQTEIDKCEVRCANCHRRKTARQFGWFAYGPQPAGPGTI